jgi:hypothetical protein
MQRFLAIMLVGWIFIVSPALCLAGWQLDPCDQGEACDLCTDCCQGHQCHRDPCRVSATIRPLQDDAEVQHVSATLDCVPPVQTAVENLSQLNYLPALCAEGVPVDLGVSRCVPLLI